MLVAFSFQAKPGREREFEQLLNNPEAGRRFAKLFGATRNVLFLGNGRMIRVLEFPEDAKPVPMGELAERDPWVKEFLRKMGPLIEDGFDIDKPETLGDFNKRTAFTLAYEVTV